MDPDREGTVGQIINFGRDEDDKIVIASNLHEFIILMTKILQSDHCRTEMYEGEKVLVLNNMYHAID